MKDRLLISIAILLIIGINNCTDNENIDLDPPLLISPADGDTISVNPPLFIWSSVDDQGCELVFWLEIADDEFFSYDSIILSTFVPLSDTFFDPVDSFNTGTYCWHMCLIENA